MPQATDELRLEIERAMQDDQSLRAELWAQLARTLRFVLQAPLAPGSA